MNPKPNGRAFEKHPSCFGKLDCYSLCEVARRNGMMIISAAKANMHCFNDIALWGTPAAMKKTEAEWTAAGNEPKPRNFKAVFSVNLATDYKDWTEHTLPPIGHQRGEKIIPEDYKTISGDEIVKDYDLAWNGVWARWEKPNEPGMPVRNYQHIIRRIVWP